MPTPLAPFVDSASTLSDAFIATGNLYSQIDTFVAWGIGVALVGVVLGLVRKAVRR